MSKKRQRVVLSGYFGFENCGDEGILMAMIQALRTLKPDLEIVVLSKNPEATSASYKVRAVHRNQLLKVVRSLFRADLFISGGGSLLQDVTSARSPLYYLGVIALAQKLSKKTMVYAQGIGPLTLKKNRQRTVKVLNKCDVITLRDQTSADELQAMGLKKLVEVVGDPVLGLEPKDARDGLGKEILQDLKIIKKGTDIRCPLLVVTLRPWQENDFFDKIAEALDVKVAAGWDVLLVPLHFPQDMRAIEKITNHMKQPRYCLGQRISPQAFFSLLKQADLVLSMRLHGLIFAMAAGTPMVALSYDPKVERFMAQADSKAWWPVSDFTVEELVETLNGQNKKDKNWLKKQENDRKKLKRQAWKAAEQAVKLLDS